MDDLQLQEYFGSSDLLGGERSMVLDAVYHCERWPCHAKEGEG